MNILIGCEFSQTVAMAFRKRGHNAFSCDILPCTGGNPSYHIQGDILDILKLTGPYADPWDMAIFHPPCTYLCSSGLHWNKRVGGRAQKTKEALEFVRKLMDCGIPKICIENPVGCISTKIRPASQYIQPYDFGEDASKKTGLWLVGLPLLKPTNHKPGRMVNGKERWSNQTDSGQNALGPSADRWAERSVTYQGVADAMADQWG